MLAVVHASRGEKLNASEAELDAIVDFFKRLQTPLDGPIQSPAVPPPPPAAPGRQVLSLPSELVDWYAPRRGEKYVPKTIDEERALYEHLVKLYSLGIPTFLMEQPSTPMRLFMPFEVSVKELFVMGGNAVLKALQEHLAEVLVAALGSVVLEFFGAATTPGLGYLCAVLDASGRSSMSGEFKVAFRLVFPEVVVSEELASRARDRFVDKLSEAYVRENNEPWVQALILPAAINDGGETPGMVGRKLFDEAVPSNAFSTTGPGQPLVWCDCIDKRFDAPEGRPLRPRLLVEVRRRPTAETGGGSGGGVEVRRLANPREVSSMSWIRLGSTRTLSSEATKIAAGRPLARGWHEYEDAEGKPYYSNKLTGDTTWTPPPEAFAQVQLVEPPLPKQQPRPAASTPQHHRIVHDPWHTARQVPPATIVAQHLDSQSQSPPVDDLQSELHLWRVYPDQLNQREYYFLPLSNRTAWELPAGGEVHGGASEILRVRRLAGMVVS